MGKNKLYHDSIIFWKTKKVIKIGGICNKYDIITIQETRVALVGTKTKIILEMVPQKIELEARLLKAATIRINKMIEKKWIIVRYWWGNVEGSYK